MNTTRFTISALIAALLALVLTFGWFTMASAHGGGTVDPEDSNCMGQLARLHANGKNPGNNPDTVPGFGTNQPHPGLGGPYDSIQEQAKAFKAFCNSDLE